MSSYTLLTQEERHQIDLLKKAGHHEAEIAATLERHKSMVSHELKRNQGLKAYRSQQAHGLALARRDEKAQPVLTSASGSTSKKADPRDLESGADHDPAGEGAKSVHQP
jgi:IS30 family transposase